MRKPVHRAAEPPDKNPLNGDPVLESESFSANIKGVKKNKNRSVSMANPSTPMEVAEEAVPISVMGKETSLDELLQESDDMNSRVQEMIRNNPEILISPNGGVESANSKVHESSAGTHSLPILNDTQIPCSKTQVSNEEGGDDSASTEVIPPEVSIDNDSASKPGNSSIPAHNLSYARMVDSGSSGSFGKIPVLPKDPKKKVGEVELSLDGLLQGSLPYCTTLVGFFIEKKPAFPTVKYFVNRMWKNYGLEDVMVNNEGFFFFKFSNEQGLQEVMENGPWLINDLPLFVMRWKPGLILSKPQISSVPVWVKIYNVPLEYWNNEGVALIANELGKPIVMDKMTQSMCTNHWGRPGYMRLLIEMSSEEDWLNSIDVISRDWDTRDRRVSKCNVEYAWKPSRCSNCKIYGHNDNKCGVLMGKKIEEDRIAEEQRKKKANEVNGNGKKIEVDDDGFTKVIKKNGRNNGASTSGKEYEDLQSSVEALKSMLNFIPKKKFDTRKMNEKRNGDSQGNQKVKEKNSQVQNRNSGNNNFNQFGVGALKNGGQGNVNGQAHNKGNDISKPKQVYVQVSPTKKKPMEARNDNKENMGVGPIKSNSKSQTVKNLANQFEIFNKVNVSSEGVMEEIVLDGNSVGEAGSESSDVQMSDGTPGVEKVNTKSSSVSQ